MEIFVLGAWLVGWIVAIIVIRARAGVGQRRIKVFGPRGFGLGWTLTAGLAAMFWPITVIIWLVRGRPEPRIVFNEKAEERRRRMEAQAGMSASDEAPRSA